jgi:hypothetical protein
MTTKVTAKKRTGEDRKYRGISLKGNRWQVSLHAFGGKHVRLGSFTTQEEAAKARDR